MSAFSVNLTDPTYTRALADAEVAAFDAPLFVTGALVCMEVVFWGARTGEWIVLVRDRTGRAFPAGFREVAAGELPAYEAALLGVR
jgi:hypothetical protein